MPSDRKGYPNQERNSGLPPKVAGLPVANGSEMMSKPRIISTRKPPTSKRTRKEKRGIWKTHIKMAPKYREGKPLSQKRVLQHAKRTYLGDKRIRPR